MKTSILAVDDNSDNRYMVQSLFEATGYRVIMTNNGREALEAALKDPPDLVLSDILMPVMDGYELCREMKKHPELRRIPFVFYTATYTEPSDEEFALSLGADRFLIKPQEPEVLLQVVQELLEERGRVQPGMDIQSAETVEATPSGDSEQDFYSRHTDVIYRKLEKKIAELEESNRRLSREIQERLEAEKRIRKLTDAVEKSPLGFVITDSQGMVEFANQRYCHSQGQALHQVLDRSCPLLGEPALDTEKQESPWVKLLQGQPCRQEIRNQSIDGKSQVQSLTWFPVMDEKSTLQNVILIQEDVTQRKLLEDELKRNQRMEELGLLAAGVAHDFNNILTAIMGFADLSLLKLDDVDSCRRSLEGILEASQRASKLTQTLLNFSRKQEPRKEVLDLNVVVQDLAHFLHHLLPKEAMELKITLAPRPLWVFADRGQVEQIVMNLLVNARDAMPLGGLVEITTQSQVPEARADQEVPPSQLAVAPEPLALLEVRDTGVGMDEATRRRIFEPFWTTKAEGQGTGLGLSLINGIVENHRGRIEVKSSPGKGSVFQIYLPLSPAP